GLTRPIDQVSTTRGRLWPFCRHDSGSRGQMPGLLDADRRDSPCCPCQTPSRSRFPPERLSATPLDTNRPNAMLLWLGGTSPLLMRKLPTLIGNRLSPSPITTLPCSSTSVTRAHQSRLTVCPTTTSASGSASKASARPNGWKPTSSE